jgi:hypothetical protein
VIYRAAKGASQAHIFFDASAEGNVSFLGVLADSPTNTLWACGIIGVGKNRHSILRSFDLTDAAPKFRWPLPRGQPRREHSARGERGGARAR